MTDTEERLLAALGDDEDGYGLNRPDRDAVLALLNDPRWEATGRVHDWRNYIPEAVCELWDRLSLEARIVAYAAAERTADKEEWD